MSTSTPTASADGFGVRSAVERLLALWRPDLPRRLEPRERRVEQLLAGLVLAGGITAALALPSDRPLTLSTTVACLAAFAVAASVSLYVGGGCALATQLVFVPMLFVLPLGAVPLLVAAGIVLAAMPAMIAARNTDRLFMALGDAGYAFAPVVVLAIAGEPPPVLAHWEPLAAAFAAQIVLDGALSVGREWLGRGIRPAVQLGVMATVYGVDALLTPIGFLFAERAVDTPLIVLATLPLSLLLAALARDRTRRLNAAFERLEALERERDRVRVAIHRTARSLGYSHDRRAMLEVALGTTVDAVAGAAGRARLAESADGITFEAVPYQPGAADCEALAAVERAALAGDPAPSVSAGGWTAIARPLVACHEPGRAILGAIAVCRAGGRFAREQIDLFSYLATQTAASIEAIGLHEQLRHPVIQDHLTGLANRQRLQALLRAEVDEAQRLRQPLSVLVVELEGLRELNAQAGFEAGDEALRIGAAVMREHAGPTIEPARLGGATLAVVLPRMGIGDVSALGDAVAAALAWHGISARSGSAELSPRVAGAEALLAAAEAARDEARRAGNHRTVAFRGQ